MSTTPQPPSAGLGAQTPGRRAISATPSSTARRAPVHTPLDRSVTPDLLRSVRRGTPASASRRKSNAPTPHAKAARRALDQRRAAMFTPGKNRRKSLMEQRETPHGILGNLARALAPKSKPISSSSTSASPPSSTRRRSSVRPIGGDEENEDDFVNQDDDISSEDPRPPRLSLPMDDADDDDEDIPPPRVSGLHEFDYTVELTRRAPSEQRPPLLPRRSSGMMSEFSINDDMTGTVGRPSDFFPDGWDALQARADEHNETLQRIDDDTTRQQLLGRESDINPQIPPGFDDQTTFDFSQPAIDMPPTPPLGERAGSLVSGDDVQDVLPPVDSDPAPMAFDDYSDDGNEPLDPFNPLQPYDSNADDSDPGDFKDAVENMVEDVTVATTTTALQPSAADKARAALAIQDARTQLQLRKKRKRVSQHGIEYPPIPSAFVKQVAQTALQSSGLSNTRVSADTLVALTQASEWFFEQLGDDLGAYAAHAKRKTIEDSDVATLMRRQRQVGSASTMFSLAQKHLPRELLQELRMPVPQPAKQRRAKQARSDDYEEDVEVT